MCVIPLVPSVIKKMDTFKEEYTCLRPTHASNGKQWEFAMASLGIHSDQ